MYGLPVRSVLYLAVLTFVPGGHASPRQQVSSALKNIRQEAGRLASAVRALNVSAVRVLDSLRQYEETSGEIMGESGGSCSHAIERLILRLFEEKIEAVQMIDASSVYQSGLTWGNIWNFGSFDECLIISVDEDNVQFVGQHCFIDVQIRFNTLPIIDPGELKDIGTLAHYWFSVCMPSTCKPSSLGQALSKLAHDADDVLIYFNYSVEIDVDDANCHTQHSPPFTVAEILGIILTAVLVGIATMCTVLDMTLISRRYSGNLKAQPKVWQYVVAFSMYSNGKRLLDTRVREDTIQGVHCLKFIGIFWVAASYYIKLTILNPLSNTIGALEFIQKWIIYLLLNIPCGVDMFFLISGILNTYAFFSFSTRRTFIGNLKSYLHRYIRLTPAYAVMILITATWMYRLESGPMWEIIVGDAKRDCDQYWWTGLLYINNYYNPTENCLFQSWYLAVDMHLFILAPLVLYCLWRWPRIGLFIIAILVSYSVIMPFYVTYKNEFIAPVALSYDVNAVNKQIELLYMPTHTNTISYVLGILCGSLLFHVKKRRAVLEIHPSVCTILWILSIAAMYWAMEGDYNIYQFDTAYNKMNVSLFTAFYRLVWCLAIVWIIVACNTGHGGPLTTLISLKMWIPLSRLTYSIFLTHAAVILYCVGSMREPMYFGFMTVIVTFLGEFVLAVALAVVLFLTVEAPFQSLEKLLRGGSGLERRKNIHVVENVTDTETPGVHLPLAMKSK